MKRYEVEYRQSSKYSDLIEIRTVKLETRDGYGIVSEYFGYKHPDGTTNVYPGYITECGICNSVICSIDRAKQIYQSEKNFLDSCICNDS